MFVYVTGEKQVAQASMTMSVAPAALIRDNEVPAEWLNADGSHKQMNVEFKYGKAEVDKNLGEFLVKHGFAQKSSLIIPAKRILGVQ